MLGLGRKMLYGGVRDGCIRFVHVARHEDRISRSRKHSSRNRTHPPTYLISQACIYSRIDTTHYHVPTHHTNPPSPIVTPKCHANPHAIANRNFGLNTVQMNKCCLNAVQATITLTNMTPVQKVNKLKCSTHAVFTFLSSLLFSSFLAISFR
jgi:hypothetical protein